MVGAGGAEGCSCPAAAIHGTNSKTEMMKIKRFTALVDDFIVFIVVSSLS